ncbi:MAG: HAMP domain-containing sensor histidine kinase [Balneolaceae bacterium]|nr:HAMP domain-containing sensor histidine kinase [Balneolaceae bacterium]
MDTQKRQLSKWQLDSLGILADEVIARLELRLKQKLLEDSKFHKDESLRIISHDMRNPLAGIIGITELIRTDGHTDPEELKYLMELVERSARKLLDNVNDLFEITKIESGGITLDPEVTDLEVITNDIIELQKPNARVKKIDLDVEINHNNGSVIVDPVRYRQILGNLVNNAVKFTPEGGNINVFVDYPVEVEGRKNIKVRVKDEGIGIPKKHQASLFSKNKNYRRQGTFGENSTGMGLPLVKNLVDAHNGSISLHSEPEKGTEFTIFLPELSRME